MAVHELETPHGRARVHLDAGEGEAGALILGHGAGGGVDAPDLLAARSAARELGFAVALVEQPYRVAGRRSPPAASRLDEAWTSIVEQLAADQLAGARLVCGGRSAGARVACRTAAQTGASAVLCLAFPLHPPRRNPSAELKTRQPELDAVAVPTLVVQGRSDPFGMPEAGPQRELVTVAGNHSLKSDLETVESAVGEWLSRLVASGAVA